MLKLSKFIISLTVFLCAMFITIVYYTIPFMKYKNISYKYQYDSHVLYTEGCKIPKFDPFDPSVIKYYKNISGDIKCKGEKFLSVQNNKVVLDRKAVQKKFKEKNFTCAFKIIQRNPKNETNRADNKFEYSEEQELVFNKELPGEFVKAFCRVKGKIVYEEFLPSTPLKPPVEERCQTLSSKIQTPEKLSVILIGIDSISKLNFERHFKLTAEYLRQNLSIFEFHGYTKVADNTFPNLTPVLTGHFVKHYFNHSNRKRYFDDLDFIWKNFSSIGYRTLYAEDAPNIGTYNYIKNGFQFPPTDYFFQPFTMAIENSPWRKASKTDCFQAKPEIVTLYNYLRSFLTTMGDRPCFAFTWAARLTHDVLNKAGYADKPTFELLRDINDMGLLNKSMLIFMSDHGIRFGGILKTFIGKIEERMPFLFMSFPRWFLDANDGLKANLITNRKRLTTPFDVHETLVDVYQMMSGDRSYTRTPYGTSLFQKISPYRDCKSAFILPHWCVCHDYKKLSLRSNATIAAAEALVDAVNNITSNYRKLCHELSLDVVQDTMVSQPEQELLSYEKLTSGDFQSSTAYGSMTDSYEQLMISVRTSPGGAEFESTIRMIKGTYKVFGISRINKYGNDGDCVDDSDMHKYCYCKIKIKS